MYTRDKEMYSRTCRKKTNWTRCPNFNGPGPTWLTTCKYRCDDGYKCVHGKSDPHHAPA